MVSDGERHGAGHRAAFAGRHRQRHSDAALEPRGGAHDAMTARIWFRQWNVRKAAMLVAAAVLLFWTVFPFVWILLTSLKSPGDIISVPPKFAFAPTFD